MVVFKFYGTEWKLEEKIVCAFKSNATFASQITLLTPKLGVDSVAGLCLYRTEGRPPGTVRPTIPLNLQSTPDKERLIDGTILYVREATLKQQENDRKFYESLLLFRQERKIPGVRPDASDVEEFITYIQSHLNAAAARDLAEFEAERRRFVGTEEARGFRDIFFELREIAGLVADETAARARIIIDEVPCVPALYASCITVPQQAEARALVSRAEGRARVEAEAAETDEFASMLQRFQTERAATVASVEARLEAERLKRLQAEETAIQAAAATKRAAEMEAQAAATAAAAAAAAAAAVVARGAPSESVDALRTELDRLRAEVASLQEAMSQRMERVASLAFEQTSVDRQMRTAITHRDVMALTHAYAHVVDGTLALETQRIVALDAANTQHRAATADTEDRALAEAVAEQRELLAALAALVGASEADNSETQRHVGDALQSATDSAFTTALEVAGIVAEAQTALRHDERLQKLMVAKTAEGVRARDPALARMTEHESIPLHGDVVESILSAFERRGIAPPVPREYLMQYGGADAWALCDSVAARLGITRSAQHDAILPIVEAYAPHLLCGADLLLDAYSGREVELAAALVSSGGGFDCTGPDWYQAGVMGAETFYFHSHVRRSQWLCPRVLEGSTH
jgi:hypothetical protein